MSAKLEFFIQEKGPVAEAIRHAHLNDGTIVTSGPDRIPGIIVNRTALNEQVDVGLRGGLVEECICRAAWNLLSGAYDGYLGERKITSVTIHLDECIAWYEPTPIEQKREFIRDRLGSLGRDRGFIFSTHASDLRIVIHP